MMSKVTVKQFLDAGFTFVVGDKWSNKPSSEHSILNPAMMNMRDHAMNNKDQIEDDYMMIECVWRENTGSLPADDFCQIICIGNNGTEFKTKVIDAPWLSTVEKSSNGANYALVSWKPDLDAIARLETSVEWSNGDVCIFEGADYIFIGLNPYNKDIAIIQGTVGIPLSPLVSGLSKPPTPEELAAKARVELIVDASELLTGKGFGHDTLMLKCLLSHGYLSNKE